MPTPTYGVRLHFDKRSFFIGRGLDYDQAADLADELFAVFCDDLGTRLSTYPEKEITA